jgi:Methyltransferase domain
MQGRDPEHSLLLYAALKREIRDRPLTAANVPHLLVRSVRCCLRVARDHGWPTSLRMGCWGVRDLITRSSSVLFPFRYPYARGRLAFGLQPASYLWGFDRGMPVHRHYVNHFLSDRASDIRGDCLEFQEDSYTTRFGGERVRTLHILHKTPGNPNATIVADITSDDVPDNRFDCIICTYVLNVIPELDKAIAGLHRMLRAGGVLLVAVPQLSMCALQWQDLWRFTPEGLALVLGKIFGHDNVTVQGYGNSLTAAGDIRGLVADEFTRSQLDYHDPRFAIVVCARAIKTGPSVERA